MFIDIHTHKSDNFHFPSIRNLTFEQADKYFASDEKGTVSVGIHPWYIDDNYEKSLRKIENWLIDKRFVAIGECGFDKKSTVTQEKQMIVFKQQIEISEKSQKPLIIHCVGCFNELLELKTEFKSQQGWIIHGFRGKPELAKQLLNAGFSLSFGEKFNDESIRITPLENLFIETDESLLPIDKIYEKVAFVKGITANKLDAGAKLFSKYF